MTSNDESSPESTSSESSSTCSSSFSTSLSSSSSDDSSRSLAVALATDSFNNSFLQAAMHTRTVITSQDQRAFSGRRAWAFPRKTWWDFEAQWPDDKFRKLFRLPRSLFDRLAEHMPIHKDTNFRKALPKRQRLAAAMRYLATGADLGVIAGEMGMAKSSAVYALDEAVTMINKELPFPSFEEGELHGIVSDFDAKGAFQGTAGCIDGTHIPIRVPASQKKEYYCYKGFTSIIIMGPGPERNGGNATT